MMAVLVTDVLYEVSWARRTGELSEPGFNARLLALTNPKTLRRSGLVSLFGELPSLVELSWMESSERYVSRLASPLSI